MAHRSKRVPRDLGPNRLAEARMRLGDIPYDLTNSNPTTCGIDYPVGVLAGLADQRGLGYRPDPRGPLSGRSAVAEDSALRQVSVDPHDIILTASTSEAYGLLFKLLANPGDAVLVPAPSYPLFEQLAHLEGLLTRTYSLEEDAGWRLDLAAIARAPETVRAVIVVHPNNPTGSFVHPDDADALVSLCRDRGWALIADEVFLPYPLEGGEGMDDSFASVTDCLCFTLGGLSKSVGLPQLKLSWIAASGPRAEVDAALEGLDFVADAYLSVSTPVALAAGEILTAGTGIREAIHHRCRANLATLHELVDTAPAVTAGSVGGGWSGVIRVPSVMADEELCLHLLEREGVALHPGLFFGFPTAGKLVASLLPPEGVFREGLKRVLRCVDTMGRREKAWGLGLDFRPS